MARTAKEVNCDFVVKQGTEIWVCKSFAYLAKRKDKLFINVLIEDTNSKNNDIPHLENNFILSRCIVNKDTVLIDYSEFNNRTKVEMTEGLKNLTNMFAREIYKVYCKEESND